MTTPRAADWSFWHKLGCRLAFLAFISIDNLAQLAWIISGHRYSIMYSRPVWVKNLWFWLAGYAYWWGEWREGRLPALEAWQ